MKSVVGIFLRAPEARAAAERLAQIAVPHDRITILAPGESAREIERVPTTETESPGTGSAVGGIVGAATGVSAGFGAAALLSIPGIGAVSAVGLFAAALLGVGGAAAGAAVGGALENRLADGIPRDELFFYENALREGRTVVVAFADSDDEADRARDVMAQAGAESVDAARERWWIGLRDVEGREERADFTRDERGYRLGFEAALHPDLRGRRFEDVREALRRRCPDVYDGASFRRGFARGQAYFERRAGGAPGTARTGT